MRMHVHAHAYLGRRDERSAEVGLLEALADGLDRGRPDREAAREGDGTRGRRAQSGVHSRRTRVNAAIAIAHAGLDHRYSPEENYEEINRFKKRITIKKDLYKPERSFVEFPRDFKDFDRVYPNRFEAPSATRVKNQVLKEMMHKDNMPTRSTNFAIDTPPSLSTPSNEESWTRLGTVLAGSSSCRQSCTGLVRQSHPGATATTEVDERYDGVSPRRDPFDAIRADDPRADDLFAAAAQPARCAARCVRIAICSRLFGPPDACRYRRRVADAPARGGSPYSLSKLWPSTTTQR